MADEPVLEIKVAGIATNADYSWTAADLYLPIANESDVQATFVETVADKLGNDPTKDIYNYLTTWKIFDNLSNGAWERFHHPDENKYWEPVYTLGDTTPLAWTLDEDAPLLPGAGNGDLSDVDYSFSDHEQFKGKIFALDTKYGRVWRFSGSVWQYFTGNVWTATVLAGTVTGATNATPIVITSTAHGLTNGDHVSIFNVGGNTGANSTAANPIWYVTVLTADTFELYSDAGRSVGVAGTGAKTTDGTWKCDASGILGTPTELINIQEGGSGYLYVGQTTPGLARRSSTADTSAAVWANWSSITAQHFAFVNKDIYYSTTSVVKNDATTVNYKVGDPNTYINRMEWYSNYLVITKPEGVWVLLPQQDSLQRIATFRTRDEDNGKVLIIHNSNIYWNADENWFKWDGYNDPEQEIGKLDGNDNRMFYRGYVRAAHSDGQNLFLIWRVDTEETTPYHNDFIVVQSGKTLGYHPIFVASSNTTEPSNYVGGLLLAGKKLYYSCGTSSTAKTGFLLTDGKIPISSTTYPYTWGVGVVTGWFDAGRETLPKWHKEVMVSTVDMSATNLAVLTLRYQKWGDSAYTLYPTTPNGTNEAVVMTPTAETGLQAGYTANKVRWKLILNNSGTATERSKMFYVRSFHAVGRIKYKFARAFSVRVWLNYNGFDVNRTNRRKYNAVTLYAGLQALLDQTAPVTVTLNGVSFLMTALPNQAGMPILQVDDSTGRAEKQYFSLTFRQEK
jgi:hypothetical protein